MIMDLKQLPFKVGQLAESKSFIVGFRSAWFRCKIKNISLQRGQIRYSLEFFDYPGEKVSWTKLYQKSPQQHNASHESKLELMVRPSFPPFYRESQLPDSYPESDVIAIVSETWKVGDLVDWWSDHCYWSGKVIQLLGNDKIQIELPDRPIGEGNNYEAFCKDLRPSLDWSPENGWTVPVSRENGNYWHCARLIQPQNQDKKSEDKDARVESTKDTERNDLNTDLKSDSPKEERPNCSSELSTSLDEVPDASDVNTNLSCRKDSPKEEKPNCSSESSKSLDEVQDVSDVNTNLPCRKDSPKEEKPNRSSESSKSLDEVQDASDVNTNLPCKKDRYNSSDFIEKKWIRESKYMASRKRPDTVESSIVELEELANKIRWLKGFLQFGFQWSNAMKPSWRFLENCESFKKRCLR